LPWGTLSFSSVAFISGPAAAVVVAVSLPAVVAVSLLPALLPVSFSGAAPSPSASLYMPVAYAHNNISKEVLCQRVDSLYYFQLLQQYF